jgi:selenocysteine-specific elongation factor
VSDRPGPGAVKRKAAERLAVVGTAGHIDHGKTAMVRRLTGIDTDRLPQEKARGISIDLGFANLTTPGGRRVGIVDVPGHERFVRNMLAGVGGIDLVLLVIAADEGVMPQTREHFAIVSLLGVSRGLVVLTKCDLVEDPEWLEMVGRDVAELVKGSFLEGAPVMRFSATTGEGSDALLKEMDRQLGEDENRPAFEPARLPVDRSFIIEGFGTVVTGTLWRGRISVGDTVAVQPQNLSARVRSVEVHGAHVETALAGQRTAVSLHGLSREQVGRGDWLTAPGSLEPARLITVRLNLLPGLSKPLKDRARVRFHLGASEILGRAALLEGTQLAPSQSAYAQIALESPAVAARGDRFVIRFYSPMVTIGGGVVLEPEARRRKRGEIDGLDVVERGSDEDRLVAALTEAGLKPLDRAALEKSLEIPGDHLEELAARTERIRRLADGRWISLAGWEGARSRIRDALAEFAGRHPVRWGRGKGELKSSFGRKFDPALFDGALASLVGESVVESRADHLRLAGEGDLSQTQQGEQDRVVAALDETGYSVPELSKLSQMCGVSEATEYVQRLLFEEKAVRVSQDFVFTAGQWQGILVVLRKHFASQDALKISDLKSLLGISRKHAIPLLEYTDRQDFTIRSGDVRNKGSRL